MTIQSVEYIAQDLIKLNLSSSAKVNSAYLNPANYQITSYIISPLAAVSVIVEEVTPINNFGPDALGSPAEAAVAADVVYLRTSKHSVGANYQVTFSELYSTNGDLLVQNAPVPYQARTTKVDSILKSIPAHFDRRSSSLIRGILSAIGIQDDKLGGSKKEEFAPPPTSSTQNTITSISNFIYFDAYYATVLGEGPQGGDEFTFWFIGWDLRTTGMLQIPFSGMSDLSALQGWVFCIDATGSVYFRIGPDAFNPVIDTPSYVLSGINENSLTVFHGVVNVPTGELTLYCNGVAVGSTLSIPGYAPTNSPITVGGFSNGAQFPLSQGGFCGGGAVEAAMTPAEVLAHYNDMVLNGVSTVPAVDAVSWNYVTANANAVWPSTGSNTDALLLNGAGLIYTEQPLVWSP